jgi:quercetin dioxygenase-like cupin family protein
MHAPLSRTAARFATATVIAVAGAAAHATAASAPTREALAAAVDPGGAKGRTLALSRVTVPAHAVLPKHHHPGTQTAYIDQGTLTYKVFTGHVDVMSGSADAPKRVRRISSGQTGKISAGQWIIERPSVHHMAQNKTGERIVIYLATLFPNGAPPSIAG